MSDELTFRSVRLFDGDIFHEDIDVVVENRSVLDVEEARGDGEVVEGEGRTLLPGLIDAHTHAYGDALRQALVFGVTTELDMFTSSSFAASMRAEQADGKAIDRADLYSAARVSRARVDTGRSTAFPSRRSVERTKRSTSSTRVWTRAPTTSRSSTAPECRRPASTAPP